MRHKLECGCPAPVLPVGLPAFPVFAASTVLSARLAPLTSTANLHVSRPSGERRWSRRQVDLHHFARHHVRRSRRTQLHSVGKVNFNPDPVQSTRGGVLYGAPERVAGSVVVQDQPGAAVDCIVGLIRLEGIGSVASFAAGFGRSIPAPRRRGRVRHCRQRSLLLCEPRGQGRCSLTLPCGRRIHRKRPLQVSVHWRPTGLTLLPGQGSGVPASRDRALPPSWSPT